MSRRLLICAFGGLLLGGCHRGTAPDAAPSNASPSMSAPNTGLSSTEGTNGPVADRPSDDSTGPIELDAITLTAPAEWQQTPSGASFVAAEFTMPRVEGDDADEIRMFIRSVRRKQ